MRSVLLVSDIPGWIFSRHCQEIKLRLSSEYHIDIGYSRGTDLARIYSQYDLIYVLDPMPIPYPPKKKTILGLRADYFWRENPEGPKGTYEKGYRCQSIKDKCCIFHVVNRKSYEAFRPFVIDKPLLLVQHGVDESVFDKKKYTKPIHDGFVMGISGRVDSPNRKGFDIIGPACIKTGIRYVSTKYQGGIRLTKEQMPNFYNGMDVYCCLSRTEGLNNPIMESGAMGIPVISTRSGAAEEMIRDGENGLLINRDEKSLIEAIEKMKDDKKRLEMGEKLYSEIMTKWTWGVKIREYRDMFEMFFGMGK